MLALAFWAGSGWLIGWWGMRAIDYIFCRFGWLAANYRGEMIPLGYGLVFSMALLVYIIICATVAQNGSNGQELLLACGLSLVVSLAGWLDDRIGRYDVKGIRGHFRALWCERRITTGAAKAGMIMSCSLGISFLSASSFGERVVNALLLALAANFINLLDVRPGRALKGFWLIMLLCLAAGTVPESVLPLFAYTLMISFAVAPYDFSGRAMLGDTGANLLGFLGGIFCVYAWSLSVKCIVVTLLLGLHFYAEGASLTVAIEKNRILRCLDQWGRVR
ncbi:MULTISPECIES: hypothetical protein [Aneurinibacillus]|uniref:UDP-N-acetylmuramyl pentapeptide phosphotransferase/UDP-N-acetylglucosamine-1-phosphate transferase n=1 Tax=Aneurinibacillus thermoaerophilus TaxID=143495 RepID=A0A1G7XQD0_ANETH|nr:MULTISPECIES: hypothetical protein [Aneurinibacillus]AMA73693.1 hypothetical protein ACH33_13045 [Aneurinibacillus sp. XH2]MED0679501.1 hypothetical protein [Aneurinibacillus thermoaerophilus]MED0737928.1 hypothetical protein [Aneurinibacillus thermoaerophilus]MED0756350.1 hypothetical protein [Aneurinibacillus thermoaerophilus]MED0760215.1 hypothetical protein [Aneurinibacillus thermoaerophilus]